MAPFHSGPNVYKTQFAIRICETRSGLQRPVCPAFHKRSFAIVEEGRAEGLTDDNDDDDCALHSNVGVEEYACIDDDCKLSEKSRIGNQVPVPRADKPPPLGSQSSVVECSAEHLAVAGTPAKQKIGGLSKVILTER